MKLRPILLLLVAIAVIYAGVRQTVLVNGERALRTAVRDLREQGVTIKFDDLTDGGFPFRVTYSLRNVSLMDRRSATRARFDKVDLISHVWTPGHWLVDLYGGQVSLLNKTIAFQDDAGRISYKKAEDGGVTIVYDSQDQAPLLVTDFPGLDRSATAKQVILSAFLPPESTDDNGLYEATTASLRLQLSGITIGDGSAPHQIINGVSATATVSGKGLDAWQPDRIRDWGMNGGLIQIGTLNIALPTTALGASGSLSVDDRLYPLGSMALQLRGGETWAKVLASGGLLKNKRARATVKALKDRQEISLMVQSGRLMLGDQLLTTMDPLFD